MCVLGISTTYTKWDNQCTICSQWCKSNTLSSYKLQWHESWVSNDMGYLGPRGDENINLLLLRFLTIEN